MCLPFSSINTLLNSILRPHPLWACPPLVTTDTVCVCVCVCVACVCVCVRVCLRFISWRCHARGMQSFVGTDQVCLHHVNNMTDKVGLVPGSLCVCVGEIVCTNEREGGGGLSDMFFGYYNIFAL